MSNDSNTFLIKPYGCFSGVKYPHCRLALDVAVSIE